MQYQHNVPMAQRNGIHCVPPHSGISMLQYSVNFPSGENADLTSGNSFGTINATVNTSRELQMGAKIIF